MTDTGELSDLVRIDRTRRVGAQRRIAHWRRFRHHDALSSRCYDGPPCAHAGLVPFPCGYGAPMWS